MEYLDYAALVMGLILIAGGIRAIFKQRVNIPELCEGTKAANIGWLWIGLGILFILAVIFDIGFLKTFFKLFLESAN